MYIKIFQDFKISRFQDYVAASLASVFSCFILAAAITSWVYAKARRGRGRERERGEAYYIMNHYESL